MIRSRFAMLWRLALGAAIAFSPCLSTASTAQSNVLLLIGDDLGVDSLAVYGEGPDVPVTPNLDALASGGILFRNTWTNPNCSPTRATILTGRYGFRTGIGDVVFPQEGFALPLAETTIPELLDLGPTTYGSAAFGKWHLGNESVGGAAAPNLAGFHHFDGTLRGALEPPPISYFQWPQVINGATNGVNPIYATKYTTDATLAWIAGQTGPWFCMVSYHAPHAPFHAPMAGTYSEDLTGLSPLTSPRPFYKAMVESLDFEIGRLLAGLGTERANTVVLFLGDNGTPRQVAQAPFLPGHAKGTIFEGGINVPLIANGPGITTPGSECDALVNSVDLYRTIADIAGVDPATVQPDTKLDSVSLLPYFADPTLPSIRTFAFAEIYAPNGPLTMVEMPRPLGASTSPTLAYSFRESPSLEGSAVGLRYVSADRAIRNERYKLVFSARNQFYDLALDPYESQDLLLVGLTAAEQAEYDSLVREANRLLSH